MPLKVPRFDQLDADTNIFFARELEHISQEMFAIDYAENRIRQLVPVSHEIPAGSKTYTYREWDRVGIAKIIAGYATDIPMADAFGKEYTSKIRKMGIGYRYGFDEIRSAKLQGRPLDSMRANACREGFEQLVDDIGSAGDSNNGLLGLLNQPNALTYTIPNGAAASPLWANKTPDEIIKDINKVGDYIWKTTKQRERPTRLLLPTNAYGIISQTARSATSDTTILQFVLANSKYFKEIDSWVKLDGAGAGGTDRMLAYTPDPSKMKLQIPMEQTPYPPQVEDLGVKTLTEGEIGGVVVYKPYSMCYADGI